MSDAPLSSDSPLGEVTLLLRKIEEGDAVAAEQILPLVYGELRRLAGARMARESEAQTLQPTALVHEAWLRLGGDMQPSWQSRRHFFGAAAEAMRRILIERARRRETIRHGGGQERLNTEEIEIAVEALPDDLVAVNDALEKFAAIDPRRAELVKLRYFAGFSIEDAAQTMGISITTANRWWVFARAWLFDELSARNHSNE